MKTISELNSKIWYRFLKVLFFGSFIIVIFSTNLITYGITDEKKISDNTFQQVGMLTKSRYSEYNDLEDIEVGKKIYDKRYDIWAMFTTYFSTDATFNPEDYEAVKIDSQPKVGDTITREEFDRLYKLPKVLIEYTNKYSLIGRIFYHVLPSIIVIFLFWFIPKLFYYVILGTFRPQK